MLRRMRVRSRKATRHWFAGLVVCAIAVNAMQFGAIEDAARHNYRALYRYETYDLFDIAIARDLAARRNVGPYVYFGRLFPGSVVTYPTSGVDIWFDFVPSMRTFGRASELRRVDYDPTALVRVPDLGAYRTPASAFAPRSGVVTTVLDERVGYYASAPSAREFIVVTPDGPPQREGHIAFVDVALLDAQTRTTLGMP